MASALASKSPKLPRELQTYCRRLGIARYVPIALGLLQECFPKLGDPRMYASSDPKSGEEWLVLDITVPGSFREVDRHYHEFTRRKIELLPAKYVGAIRLHHRRT